LVKVSEPPPPQELPAWAVKPYPSDMALLRELIAKALAFPGRLAFVFETVDQSTPMRAEGFDLLHQLASEAGIPVFAFSRVETKSNLGKVSLFKLGKMPLDEIEDFLFDSLDTSSWPAEIRTRTFADLRALAVDGLLDGVDAYEIIQLRESQVKAAR
jgi:hypothetical protein